MDILLTKREVYGNVLYYPANEAAKVVTFLTSRKTISKSDIDKLKKLGHKVQLEVPTL